MKQLRNTTRVLATIVTALILLSSLQGIVSAQSELDPVVILFDESHGQQYARDDETGGLKLILDTVNASTKYSLHVNADEELTDTLLSDVDILIIAAPDESNPFSEDEANGISELLANGSSLFVLGDPNIGENSEYWAESLMQDMGENVAVNNFLDAINVTRAPNITVKDRVSLYHFLLFLIALK